MGLYPYFKSILDKKEKLHDFLQKATELNKIYLFQDKLQIELIEKNSPSKIKI